jgi:Ni,Fe-hydrogenase I large subunit
MGYLSGAVVEVDPISRIEGHLGVKLHTDAGGYVTGADVHGNLWRGFENFLIGRNANDAITFTQRICGVCPVPHGTTSLFAVEAAYGYNNNFQTFSSLTDPNGVPPKALLIRNLVLSAEFLMSSLTHFYHLAAPSYVQGPNIPPWTPYWDNSYYHPLLRSTGKGIAATSNASAVTGTVRQSSALSGATLPLNGSDGYFSGDLWSAVIKQYVKALRIRRLTFEAGAMFAGRMPMTSAWVAGGVTTDHSANLSTKISKFYSMIVEVGTFIATEYVPLLLALGALYPNFDNLDNATMLNGAASGLWEMASADNVGVTPTSVNTGWGAGVGNFISWGGFPNTNGTLGLGRGYILKGNAAPTGVVSITSGDVLANLREHVVHSRYAYGSGDALAAGYAANGISDPSVVTRTVPQRSASGQYSWLKAPRWSVGGVATPMEVGPLATMYIAGVWKPGVSLATSIGLSPWLKSGGLNPAMIGADLAVALVRTKLAKLFTTISGTVDDVVINTLTSGQIIAAYQDPGSYIIDGDLAPLVTYITLLKGGLSTIDRLRARAVQSVLLVQKMIGAIGVGATAPTFPALVQTGAGGRPTDPAVGWLQQLAWENVSGIADTFTPKTVPTTHKMGFGATEAPRGALMHFCTIDAGVISAYQCVVPTTWNAGPKDAGHVNGPMEQSMIGVPYSSAGAALTSSNNTSITAGGGVEAMRVAQSFDPCIACAVH